MADQTPLTADELTTALAGLPGWELRNGTLHRELEFKNFRRAFAFMTTIALWAEKLDHHPDWSNSYKRVTIALRTHDAGGITPLDIKLAEIINKCAQQGGA
ncbi:MAG TPA: 4a-hydroxytetrahydrobiopterin dehydratase [bacterium]|nr:4a-hydroxytetrahydrobiopterin dehydratase [bacterium]